MAWVKERITDDGDRRFVACYRDPEGRQRSAGTYSSRRAAERAANREDAKVRDGAWHDHSRGEVTFAEYVETVWLPSKHVEVSTLAAYRSYLDKHFIPVFGKRPMGKILPTEIQRWVTTAVASGNGNGNGPGLSAASVRKYHTMLGSIFERALRDRVVTFNPCAHTELPKVIKRKARTLTPAEYDAILASLPDQHRLMIETAINTGLRWGELIALKPRHLDLIKRTLTVEETVVEVSIKNSPTGQRMLTKPYPKDNEPRTMGLPAELVGQLAAWITGRGLRPGDLLFATRDGTPISRNTFRTRIWLPAIKASGVDFDVRVHDLRHAHASWLLAGGSDLKAVMDRMGHAQITTTQKYLHPMPDADDKNLTALDRIRHPGPEGPGPGPDLQRPGHARTPAVSLTPAFKRASRRDWTPGFSQDLDRNPGGPDKCQQRNERTHLQDDSGPCPGPTAVDDLEGAYAREPDGGEHADEGKSDVVEVQARDPAEGRRVELVGDELEQHDRADRQCDRDREGGDAEVVEELARGIEDGPPVGAGHEQAVERVEERHPRGEQDWQDQDGVPR